MWLNAYYRSSQIQFRHLSLVHDLVERHESVNAGMRVLATVTTANAGIERRVHELRHQQNAIEQENTQLKVSIAQVTKDTNR
jgi:hypothetical protein